MESHCNLASAMMSFLHIPKNAGSSINQAVGVKGTNHYPLRWRGIDPRIKVDTEASIFTTIRNPYDRVMSIFYFLKKSQRHPRVLRQRKVKGRSFHRMTEFEDANDFVAKFYGDTERFRHNYNDDDRTRFMLWNTQCFYYEQINFINEADGEPISERIDKVLRFETLADDWPEFASAHGFSGLPHVNQSGLRNKRKWQDELTAESIAKIGELYADDFEHLNYERIS